MSRPCIERDCPRPSHGYGLCQHHLRRLRLAGELLPDRQPPTHPAPYTADEVLAGGCWLMRCRWQSGKGNSADGDWLPDPDGTHDSSYYYRGSLYLVEVSPRIAR